MYVISFTNSFSLFRSKEILGALLVVVVVSFSLSLPFSTFLYPSRLSPLSLSHHPHKARNSAGWQGDMTQVQIMEEDQQQQQLQHQLQRQTRRQQQFQQQQEEEKWGK